MITVITYSSAYTVCTYIMLMWVALKKSICWLTLFVFSTSNLKAGYLAG